MVVHSICAGEGEGGGEGEGRGKGQCYPAFQEAFARPPTDSTATNYKHVTTPRMLSQLVIVNHNQTATSWCCFHSQQARLAAGNLSSLQVRGEGAD